MGRGARPRGWACGPRCTLWAVVALLVLAAAEAVSTSSPDAGTQPALPLVPQGQRPGEQQQQQQQQQSVECGERFAVGFHDHKATDVLRQLREQGFTVHSSGPGFAAVSLCTPAAGRGQASTDGPASGQQQLNEAGERVQGQQQQQQQKQPDAGALWHRGLMESAAQLVAGAQRALRRRRQLQALAALEGVHAAERDVLRYLLRPAPQTAPQAAPAGAAAPEEGARGLVRRVLRAALRGATLVGYWSGARAAGADDQVPPGPSPYSPWELDQSACSFKDTPLDDYAGGEVMPWGIRAIQADSKLLPESTIGSGVTVCIIDSGLWAGHPDLKPNRLSGCGMQSNGGGGGGEACPFAWDSDVVAHGTHVAGTIGAKRNGRGVVGVIPGGADIYMVRIWNTSGDVSQGQGLYASDLVRAYAACEDRLDALKAANPGKPQRMVVSMSFGSAGPLTVERLWFEGASKRRDDLLFVAASGNNGSDWSSLVTPATSDQWMSYPASYDLPNLLSVANANCQGGIADSSQRNSRVAIAAPGMRVLSTVPDAYKYVRAAVQLDGVSAKAVRAAAGMAEGAKFAYPEPRAMQDARVASTGAMRPLVDCAAGAPAPAKGSNALFPACSKAAGGGVCLIGLPGKRDIYEEACGAMLACIEGGGGALVSWRGPDVDELRAQRLRDGRAVAAVPLRGGPRASPKGGGVRGWDGSVDDVTGGFDPWAPASVPRGFGAGGGGGYDDSDREILPGARLNCGTPCGCWADLDKKLRGGAKMLPGVFVGKRQALDMLTALKAAGGGGGGQLRANVTVYDYPYRHYDGTSMATPHVAGGAARVWAAFPGCGARDVARALKESASKAALSGSGPFSAIAAGAGLLQVEDAYLKLKSFPCAQTAGTAAGR